MLLAKRWFALALGAVLVVGCGDDDGNGGTGGSGGTGGNGTAGTGGSSDCAAPAFDIAGTFNERYTCRFVESQDCAGVDVAVVVVIDESTNGVDYTFVNQGDVTMGTGKLCGNEFEWTSMSTDGAGFVEAGTWTFSDGDNATIDTEFTGPDGVVGECVGVATTGADPGPPPDLPCNPVL